MQVHVHCQIAAGCSNYGVHSCARCGHLVCGMHFDHQADAIPVYQRERYAAITGPSICDDCVPRPRLKNPHHFREAGGPTALRSVLVTTLVAIVLGVGVAASAMNQNYMLATSLGGLLQLAGLWLLVSVV